MKYNRNQYQAGQGKYYDNMGGNNPMEQRGMNPMRGGYNNNMGYGSHQHRGGYNNHVSQNYNQNRYQNQGH
jgi:hypothetical protein